MLDDQKNQQWLSHVKDIYVQSASNLEDAKNELLSYNARGLHFDFLEVKFMASLIHNDVCREIFCLESNPTVGDSKLLSIAQVILKLFEANLWYSKIGNKRLLVLAKSRGMEEFVRAKLKEIKFLGSSGVEKYADIRNYLSAHYVQQSPVTLQKLGTIQADTFFKDIEMTTRYRHEWLKVLRSVGKLEVPHESL